LTVDLALAKRISREAKQAHARAYVYYFNMTTEGLRVSPGRACTVNSTDLESNTMKRLIITTAIALALAAPALASANYTSDLACDVKDGQGNVLTYIFVLKEDHPTDASGEVHGVMYELVSGKNGVPNQQRDEPLWTISGKANGAYLVPQTDPRWTLFVTAGVGNGTIPAELLHDEDLVAKGVCEDMHGEATAIQQQRDKNQRDKFVYNGLQLLSHLAGMASAIHR
jgi:hypothetical protein